MKSGRLPGGAADEQAMSVRIAEQFSGIAHIHTAAIEDRPRRAAHCRHDLVDQRHDSSDLVYCRRGAVLADGPNRLVRDDHLPGLGWRELREGTLHLCAYEVLRAAGVADRRRLADADQRDEVVGYCCRDLQSDGSIGFPEMLPAIRVANFDQGCAGVLRHPHGDLASPGALGGPVSVLGAEQHWRVDGQTITNPGQRRVRRQYEGLDATRNREGRLIRRRSCRPPPASCSSSSWCRSTVSGSRAMSWMTRSLLVKS